VKFIIKPMLVIMGEMNFSADLGGSSKYSNETFSLKTEVEKGSM